MPMRKVLEKMGEEETPKKRKSPIDKHWTELDRRLLAIIVDVASKQSDVTLLQGVTYTDAHGLRMRLMQASAAIQKYRTDAPKLLVEAAESVAWRVHDMKGRPANVMKLTKAEREKEQWTLVGMPTGAAAQPDEMIEKALGKLQLPSGWEAKLQSKLKG